MADSVWGQRFSDEQFVQLLRVDAHKIRQRATERLQKAGGSLNWMLRARKSLGLAVGRLEALELEYDPEAPYLEAMQDAFDAGMEAVRPLGERNGSPEEKLQAAQALGCAMGWLDILELRHDPDAPGAVEVCNLSLRLRTEWERALWFAAGPADRRETRTTAPGIRRTETGQRSNASEAQRGVNE